MKRSTKNAVSFAFSIIWILGSTPALAAEIGKANYAPPNTAPRVSDRLIVKLRPNYLPKGLSVAQISTELSRPFAAQTVSQMQAAAGINMTEMHALSNGAHVFSIPGPPNKQAIDRAIAGIAGLANVEYAEEDTILTIQTAPNDTYYPTGPTGNPGQWGMWPVSAMASPAPGGTGSYGANFETAWLTNTGTGVVVAVVDTGITPHVDIVGPAGTVFPATGNLVSPGYDFITDCRVRGSCAATTLAASAVVAASPDATDLGDFIAPGNSSWHGTHVAGTIAAIGNNNIGVIGGAYNAKILPVRVLGKGGGYASDIAEGIKWAAGVHPTIANTNPAKVINLSLGGIGACPSITIGPAINAAVAAGAVVVVAAGNSNTDVAYTNPANCNNVISVAAIARDGSRAYYSNFSSPTSNTTNPIYVTLAAPGSDQGYLATIDPGILSTLNTSSTTPDTTAAGSVYGYEQGTSMATPHVSAAVALMLSRNPALTPAQVKTILSAPATLTAFPSFQTSTGLLFPARDCATSNNCGAGILNAKLAVQNSITPLTVSSTTIDFGMLATNSTTSNTATLTNLSQGSLTTGAVTITGPNAAFFTVITNTCNPAIIAPQGTCQITINYAPTAAGSHSATLSVPTSTAGVTTTVGLTGIAGSPLIIATTTVTAATVNVGQSTTVDLTFANPNATAEMVGVLTLSQPSIMATSVDTCSNTTLAAGATCGVTVTITPAAVGAYSGAVTVGLSNGRLSPTQVTISGTANAAPAPATGGGGGGCSIMPAGANPDSSLPLALLVMLVYWLRQRLTHTWCGLTTS